MASIPTENTPTSTEKTTNGDESTVKPPGSRASKISNKKLRFRQVWLTPHSDALHAHFKSILKTELPQRVLGETTGLQKVMRDFLAQVERSSKDSCYPYIDDFSFNCDREKSNMDCPIINEMYFQANLNYCLAGNEAILQRTIMMHIINPYWLGENFYYNCEGQWSLPKISRLPSTKNDGVSMPKPDLSISFKLQTFTQAEAHSDPIPDHLEKTLSPDGDERCFPFLFVEAKKAAADLKHAYMTNLHTASQALYNMYTWMNITEESEKDFFCTVRVFTLVLNAQDLSVRIHRPCKAGDGSISYRFEEFWPLSRYSRDQACQLIKTIVNEYAAKELHRVLKNAFAEVSKQEEEVVKSKRKAGPPPGGQFKRRRKSPDATGQTGQSFDMGRLST